ncbi:hypothetical protein AMTR_s00023p00247490 [Amborella trichopoda]|uniref:Uncharacterized protein n=1 Tax=Amborella trichopoda TaxID=13333 RepID=W1NKP6_AMBTC|nr:hypothetical protein AMTR_s00023p00247490 [Amborella trichopoda]
MQLGFDWYPYKTELTGYECSIGLLLWAAHMGDDSRGALTQTLTCIPATLPNLELGNSHDLNDFSREEHLSC